MKACWTSDLVGDTGMAAISLGRYRAFVSIVMVANARTRTRNAGFGRIVDLFMLQRAPIGGRKAVSVGCNVVICDTVLVLVVAE